jgi:hypothetical protein
VVVEEVTKITESGTRLLQENTQHPTARRSTHPFSRLDPKPVFPLRSIPPVTGYLRGIAVLDVTQQRMRLVGFEGREFGSDEDGLLLEYGTQPGFIRRVRPRSQCK